MTSNQILTDNTLEEIQSHIARIEPNTTPAITGGYEKRDSQVAISSVSPSPRAVRSALPPVYLNGSTATQKLFLGAGRAGVFVINSHASGICCFTWQAQ
jgi:hypothetical protein